MLPAVRPLSFLFLFVFCAAGQEVDASGSDASCTSAAGQGGFAGLPSSASLLQRKTSVVDNNGVDKTGFPSGWVDQVGWCDSGVSWTRLPDSRDPSDCARECLKKTDCFSFEWSGRSTCFYRSHVHGPSGDGTRRFHCYKRVAEGQCGDLGILPTGVAVHVEELAAGIHPWGDKAYPVSGNVPEEMSGALFYRLANFKSSTLTFSSMSIGSTLFICHRVGKNKKRTCGYDTRLPADDFSKISDWLAVSIDSDTKIQFQCYQRLVNAESLTLPTTTSCPLLVAVKCVKEDQCGNPDILPGVAMYAGEIEAGILAWGDMEHTVGKVPEDMLGALFYRLGHSSSSSESFLTFSKMSIGSTLFVCSATFLSSFVSCGYDTSLPAVGFSKIPDLLGVTTPKGDSWFQCFGMDVTLPSFTLPAVTVECAQLVAVAVKGGCT